MWGSCSTTYGETLLAAAAPNVSSNPLRRESIADRGHGITTLNEAQRKIRLFAFVTKGNVVNLGGRLSDEPARLRYVRPVFPLCRLTCS
jgi:hypothetical protein